MTTTRTRKGPITMPTMKTIALGLVMLMASCLGSLSCATAGSTTPHRVQWPPVAQCVQVSPDELYLRVEAVLLSDSPAQSTLSDRAVLQLEDMAAAHGPDLIACLLDQAVKAFTPPASPSARALMAPSGTARAQAAAAERGREFLLRIGTRVSRGEP